jgi:hypothetical protein
MTGSHEVRGSIPLGSTNIAIRQGASVADALSFCLPMVCQDSRLVLASHCAQNSMSPTVRIHLETSTEPAASTGAI